MGEVGSAQTGSRKLGELADGTGKTPRPGWGTVRETQCSLTKAVTCAHEIQTPRRGFRPQAPGARQMETEWEALCLP